MRKCLEGERGRERSAYLCFPLNERSNNETDEWFERNSRFIVKSFSNGRISHEFMSISSNQIEMGFFLGEIGCEHLHILRRNSLPQLNQHRIGQTG